MGSNTTTETTVSQMLEGMASYPALFELLTEMRRDVASLRAELAKREESSADSDGWIDAAKAAKYIDMCRSTFEKYRYESQELKGCKVGGKTLYKKADLDSFVKLYEARSMGLV